MARPNTAAACKDTSKLERACSRLSIVPFATGPKRSMGHLPGAEKLIFLIREIDDAATVGASVESCRFAARRSPRGRFWSVVDVRKRLQRVRDPFHQSIHIKQGAQPFN